MVSIYPTRKQAKAFCYAIYIFLSSRRARQSRQAAGYNTGNMNAVTADSRITHHESIADNNKQRNGFQAIAIASHQQGQAMAANRKTGQLVLRKVCSKLEYPRKNRAAAIYAEEFLALGGHDDSAAPALNNPQDAVADTIHQCAQQNKGDETDGATARAVSAAISAHLVRSPRRTVALLLSRSSARWQMRADGNLLLKW